MYDYAESKPPIPSVRIRIRSRLPRIEILADVAHLDTGAGYTMLPADLFPEKTRTIRINVKDFSGRISRQRAVVLKGATITYLDGDGAEIFTTKAPSILKIIRLQAGASALIGRDILNAHLTHLNGPAKTLEVSN